MIDRKLGLRDKVIAEFDYIPHSYRRVHMGQAMDIREIKCPIYYLKDQKTQDHHFEVVRSLKVMHRVLGGLAIHADDQETLESCQFVVNDLEDRLQEVKTILAEVIEDGSNKQREECVT